MWVGPICTPVVNNPASYSLRSDVYVIRIPELSTKPILNNIKLTKHNVSQVTDFRWRDVDKQMEYCTLLVKDNPSGAHGLTFGFCRCSNIFVLISQLYCGCQFYWRKKLEYQNKPNEMCKPWTAYPSGVPEFNPGVWWDSCCSILLFCVFCRSLFVFFPSFCYFVVCPFRFLITPYLHSNSISYK